MKNQHKKEDITSIKITEDVRVWINEVRQILRENLDKPSLTQNETLRWMCVETIGAVENIVRINYDRTHNVLNRTTEKLDIERLRSRSAVSQIRKEESESKSEQGTLEESD